MKVGDKVKRDGLPYKVISKHDGFDDNYFVLEPIHDSAIIRCAKIRVFEKDISQG